MKVHKIFRIRNLLYGNDCLNYFDLVTNIFSEKRMISVPKDLVEAHETIKAERKLAII